MGISKMAPAARRLYAKGVFTGFKRGLRNQHENTALVKVEGCANKDDSKWYIGKRCAYVYRAKNKTSVPNKPKGNTNSWQCWFSSSEIRQEPSTTSYGQKSAADD